MITVFREQAIRKKSQTEQIPAVSRIGFVLIPVGRDLEPAAGRILHAQPVQKGGKDILLSVLRMNADKFYVAGFRGKDQNSCSLSRVFPQESAPAGDASLQIRQISLLGKMRISADSLPDQIHPGRDVFLLRRTDLVRGAYIA